MEEERNIESCMPSRDLGHNAGMCSDQDPNLQPFSLQAGAQSTEPHTLASNRVHIFKQTTNFAIKTT